MVKIQDEKITAPHFSLRQGGGERDKGVYALYITEVERDGNET